MHIHVHLGRLTFEENKRERVTAFRQGFVIALDQGIIECAAVHRPLVDEDHHFMPGRPPHSGSADQTTQAHAILLRLNRQQRFRRLPPKYFRDALCQRGTLRRAEYHAAVLNQGKRRLRTSQGVESDALDDMRRLGLIRFEKLSTRWHRVEQMGHHDSGADRSATIAHMQELATIDENLRADIAVGLPRLQFKA